MSSVYDVQSVRDLFRAEEENEGYLELEDLSEGDKITFVEAEAEVPDGWTLTVVDSKTDLSYDSYGYGSSEGYLVFSVEDITGEKALYKLHGGYQSYEGWVWDYNTIDSTERKQKVITTWEWTD